MNAKTMTTCVHVVIEGQDYLVELDDPAANPVTVRVNGHAYHVQLANGGPGITPHVETAAPAGAVQARPEVARPARRPPAVQTPCGDDMARVVSPMPGIIRDIAVKAGDRIVAGQQLCALEAMKMKSAIRSPRDGVIAEVTITEGRTVAYGNVLFTFE